MAVAANSIKRVLHIANVDRPLLFLLSTRIWQLATGPITLVLVARHLTAEVQGLYFTFGSLIALQSFVELGLTIVVTNTASHEWAGLSLDSRGRIQGDDRALSRLISLGRLVFTWYAAAAMIFIVSTGLAGYLLFRAKTGISVQWSSPWFSLVLVTSLQFWTLPFVALLEGCNQIQAVNAYRLRQAVIGNLTLWASLALGLGLWAPVLYAAANTGVMLALVIGRHAEFFSPFRHVPTHGRISWRAEIWPMQWRLALSGIVNYFALSLYNPVMFYYHGPRAAGQMGMTLMIVNGIQALALSWLYVRVPTFGVLVARRQFKQLDASWWRTSTLSFAACFVGAIIVWLAIYGIHIKHVQIGNRLLLPLPTGLFLTGIVVGHVVQCEAAYLRAHRQEPIVAMSVTMSLASGCLVWWWGSRSGPIGAATGYVLTSAVALIWATVVWARCRRLWHAPSIATPLLENA